MKRIILLLKKSRVSREHSEDSFLSWKIFNSFLGFLAGGSAGIMLLTGWVVVVIALIDILRSVYAQEIFSGDILMVCAGLAIMLPGISLLPSVKNWAFKKMQLKLGGTMHLLLILAYFSMMIAYLDSTKIWEDGVGYNVNDYNVDDLMILNPTFNVT